MHQWATAYGQDPPAFLGIDSRRDPWLAWQVRRAVYTWGAWFDARRQETVERPVPRDHKATMRVPKWSEAQLRQMLGIAPEATGTEIGYRIDGGRIVREREIEAMAKDVLSGAYGDEDEG
jgi:hypothetical protein